MTSVYVFALHTRHATYLQETCTVFHHFTSLTTAIFSERDIIKRFSLYTKINTLLISRNVRCNSSTLSKAQKFDFMRHASFSEIPDTGILIPLSEKKNQLSVTQRSVYMRSATSTRIPRVYEHKVKLLNY